jgi:hypothetical protein
MYALIDLSNQMLEVNNQLYTGLALSFSPGCRDEPAGREAGSRRQARRPSDVRGQVGVLCESR